MYGEIQFDSFIDEFYSFMLIITSACKSIIIKHYNWTLNLDSVGQIQYSVESRLHSYVDISGLI